MRKQSEKETNPGSVVTVLSLSPNEEDHRSLERIFDHSSWKLYKAENLGSGLSVMRERNIPVVLCESDLHPGSWKDVIENAGRMDNPPTVIVASRLADDHLWSEVLNFGGYDVLAKPFRREEVFRSLSLAWLNWRNRRRTSAGAAAQPALLRAAG